MFLTVASLGARTTTRALLRRRPVATQRMNYYNMRADGAPEAGFTSGQLLALDAVAGATVLLLFWNPSAYDHDMKYRREVDEWEAERMRRARGGKIVATAPSERA